MSPLTIVSSDWANYPIWKTDRSTLVITQVLPDHQPAIGLDENENTPW